MAAIKKSPTSNEVWPPPQPRQGWILLSTSSEKRNPRRRASAKKRPLTPSSPRNEMDSLCFGSGRAATKGKRYWTNSRYSLYSPRQAGHTSRCACNSVSSSVETAPSAASAEISSKRSCLLKISTLHVNAGQVPFYAGSALQKILQLLQSAIIVVAHVGDRFIYGCGNLAHALALKASHLDYGALPITQRR